ncbi:MAG: hypothetical protein GY792_22870 [Gammaproteobacteria bacterium]|nr:hypothetical protein [Gammaproteobacteria bacterium]
MELVKKIFKRFNLAAVPLFFSYLFGFSAAIATDPGSVSSAEPNYSPLATGDK